ncbi:uncharacterized protein L969DRAFT_86359 [Mixia osmundae IAM 14324]|uniref:Cation-transporting ATPase n=1 Tax=Mixia osmundae (strain CBS 9802 / IAM 14324 / JCM 22182 / KY 12970) TaxID=764103 RepID=G7DUI1_MIXOS|nr:uncharacterized protein L969DRAFT_86359 [Mixia osmundae IAM 14324]KEI41113.1 hypothetical protein L969DRAFT_86359 [Mixia osmundae IAM 14324]GAA94241.1 hypothetical protein E5Q_00890 [Mixia osmundae IAM 14324]
MQPQDVQQGAIIIPAPPSQHDIIEPPAGSYRSKSLISEGAPTDFRGFFTPADGLTQQQINEDPVGLPTIFSQLETAGAGQDEEDMPVYDDPTGSLFSGPVAESVPTGITGMRIRPRSKGELTRLSGEYDDGASCSFGATSQHVARSIKSSKSSRSRSNRRMSGVEASQTQRRSSTGRPRLASSASNLSVPGVLDSESDPELEHAVKQSSSSSYRRQARPSAARRQSTLSVGSAASSRRSISSRRSEYSIRGKRARKESSPTRSAVDSEDDDAADPYGPYGSSVSTSSTTTTNSVESTDSRITRSRRHRAAHFPFGSYGGFGNGDPLFGESRVDIGELSEDGDDEPAINEDLSSTADNTLFGRKPRLLASRQSVYIVDEDLQILFVGWGQKTYKRILWFSGCILSIGILWLIGRWIPRWWLQGRGKERDFARADFIVVESQHGDRHIEMLQTISLPGPTPLTDIFAPGCGEPPTSRTDIALASQTKSQADAEASTPLNGSVKSNRPMRRATMLTEVRYVDYRYYRFLLHPVDNKFRMARDWKDPEWSSALNLRKGVTAAAVYQRTSLFGNNAIEIRARTVWQLFVDEVLHPFYVFQIISIVLWSYDDYVAYAATIALISIISITTTLVETKRNVERMREMSRFSCSIRIWRAAQWTIVDSTELVPGDLIDLGEPGLQIVPADLIMLSGDAIVNESMLTGESVPVSKSPVDDSAIKMLQTIGGEIPPALSKHVLFFGTGVIRIRRTAGPAASGLEAVGIVLRTGFDTTKGALVRSMLFPKPMGFKFYRDSFRFIGVLAGIAVIGFIASSVNFIKLGIKWHTIVVRALDLVTIVVPPALPATMSIGTSFAISRLRKAGIFCISPNRVNIGGKINLACFDKTGTLTEEGLDVLGVRNVHRIDRVFSDLHDDVNDVPIFGAEDAKTPLLHALATCHGLKIVNGEVIGDPLDLRMFEFTGWSLEEGKEGTVRPDPQLRKSNESKRANSRVPERAATLVQTVVRPPGTQGFQIEDALRSGSKHAHFLELGVIRTFEFVSALRRMSVLVKKLRSSSVEVYVKGAPEVMTDICLAGSLPDDYHDCLEFYTKHGFRVIAVAAKSIPGLTWIKAQRMKREVAESELRFLGLIIFENKLKPGTTPAIHTLANAHIAVRMCTGDNIRTAVSVARECGMIEREAAVYLPRFLEGHQLDPDARLEWFDVEDERLLLNPYSLKPIIPDNSSEDRSIASLGERMSNYALAVSGDVFRWMIDYGAQETLQRMLVRGVVFARMSPDEKHELVERLQDLGYTVGFCGDGANDCGALKAADVGLSLSEAEASVAAPFTSRSPDISCFIEVIREGRAALVTSFSCFKFMASYSIIQFATVTALYAIASSLGDFQFLYIDLFIILPIAVTMGRTAPYPRIHPKRPTANLISKKVLTSLIGQMIITTAFQFGVFFYVRAQPWYRPPKINPDVLKTKNDENSALFLLSSFQYIIVAVIFCVGPPYRQPIHTNVLLLVTIVILSAFSLFAMFVEHGKIYKLLDLVHFPREFHLELLLLVILNALFSWVWEHLLASRLASAIGTAKRRYRRWRGTRRIASDKLYKSIARDMEDD